jgi:hypothetical protein
MGSCFSSRLPKLLERGVQAQPPLSTTPYVPSPDTEGFTQDAEKETLRKIKGIANATSGELLLISYDIGTTACK